MSDLYMAWYKDGHGKWHLASTMTELLDLALTDCQDEPPPTAQTPEEADEILDRMGHG
jgi:hypothetical protein